MSWCCKVCHEIDCECDENVLHYKKEMEDLLRLASEKLKLYRDQHSGEYIGGMEYQALQDKIKEALK